MNLVALQAALAEQCFEGEVGTAGAGRLSTTLHGRLEPGETL